MQRAHPVKNLGGGGFAFEDEVGAWMAAALLAGSLIADGLGPLTRIDSQVEADGWVLDDLLLTFDGVRCGFSIKSYPQIDSGRATGDFVERAWKEVLGVSASGFDVLLISLAWSPHQSTSRPEGMFRS